jgi:LacI family transcriptional regulator
VVGFDDSAVARLPFLDLTTLRPDPLEMARLAIDAADRRIADPRRTAEHPRVPVELVVRSSTGPAPVRG